MYMYLYEYVCIFIDILRHACLRGAVGGGDGPEGPLRQEARSLSSLD